MAKKPTKVKKTKAPRKNLGNYDDKLEVKGTFLEIMKAAVKDTDK